MDCLPEGLGVDPASVGRPNSQGPQLDGDPGDVDMGLGADFANGDRARVRKGGLHAADGFVGVGRTDIQQEAVDVGLGGVDRMGISQEALFDGRASVGTVNSQREEPPPVGLVIVDGMSI